MTQRIKEFPWHETPLGPIVSWPISLQVALSICLSSRFPVVRGIILPLCIVFKTTPL